MMGAIINVGAEIGPGTMIDMGAVLGGRAIVGAHSHVGAGAVLAGVVEWHGHLAQLPYQSWFLVQFQRRR